jgi:hypothetical protein
LYGSPCFLQAPRGNSFAGELNLEALKSLLAANNLFGILNILLGRRHRQSFNRSALVRVSVGYLYITANHHHAAFKRCVSACLKEAYYEEGAAEKSSRIHTRIFPVYITVPLAIFRLTISSLTFLVSQKCLPGFRAP